MTQVEIIKQLVDAAARLEKLSKELPSNVTAIESTPETPQELLTKFAEIEKELRTLSHVEKKLIDVSLLLTILPSIRSGVDTILRENSLTQSTHEEIASTIPLILEIKAMCTELTSTVSLLSVQLNYQNTHFAPKPKSQKTTFRNWATAMAAGMLALMACVSHLQYRSINEKLLEIETSISINAAPLKLERLLKENRKLKAFPDQLKTRLQKLPDQQRTYIMKALVFRSRPMAEESPGSRAKLNGRRLRRRSI